MVAIVRRLFREIIVVEGLYNRTGAPSELTETSAKNWPIITALSVIFNARARTFSKYATFVRFREALSNLDVQILPRIYTDDLFRLKMT